MISIVRFWDSLAKLAKIGTAGYETQEQFNLSLQSVETSLMSTLAPLYNSSRAVKDLLAPFVVPDSATTDPDGSYDKPADYFQLAAVSVDGYPATEVDVNEIQMLMYLPSRRPSVTDNRYAYYEESDKIMLLPEDELDVSIKYIRHPVPGQIVLTATETDEDDYVTPTSGSDLEWPERAFNLLLFLMLQRFGVEIEKQLLIEYSNLGIQFETSKI